MTEKILVIKLSALGDFILALGSMEAIRKKHPDADITLLTTKPFADIGQKSGYFNRVMITKRHKWHDFVGWLSLRKQLRDLDVSRVYDLQMNGRTATYYKYIFGGHVEWSGVVKGASHQYKNPEWRDMHAFERHKDVLKEVGIEKIDMPSTDWMTADISFYGLTKPYVVIVPGCAPTRLDKRWPPMRYAGLAKKLVRDGLHVVVLGTDAERDATEKIVKACPEATDLTGQTSLFEVMAITRDALATIGNDTGPVHMAAATGCPTMALFSSASNPEHSAPRGHDVRIIQTDDLNLLSVNEVWKEFQETLATKQAV